MLSGFAFYIYKHRAKAQSDTRKLVGEGSSAAGDSHPPPASTFLYIGTVEPADRGSVADPVGQISSPYRKLDSIKRSDRYRPSPDLQPLPPLPKPPVAAVNSPPPGVSSDEEESNGSAFYTPNGSSFSNDDGSYMSSQSNPVSKISRNPNPNQKSVPHSKRTSPKSRFSVSSSPEVKSPPPPPLQGQFGNSRFGFSPKRPKFAPPPPPPDVARLQSITARKPPMPPPPPPLPPRGPLSAPKKLVESGKSIYPKEKEKAELKEFSPKLSLKSAEKKAMEEATVEGEDDDGSRPKLKPLHWDKVRATSEKATVWDQLKSSSFQLNEDMMETLFGCNSANSAPKEASRRSVLPPIERENRVLDPKKSQNIAILLRALNVTRDEVSEALLDGNLEGMGAELLETLVKMAPTKEEEIKLKEYKGDVTKLGSAERFLKTVLDIPFAFKRVEAMLYRANFDSELKDLRKSFQTLEAASEELKISRLFLKLLEAVLRTGNRMNVGTNRGDARAFKLDTLLKLVDVKGTDGKTTLLHFVVQEIIRSEGAGSNLMVETNSKLREDDFSKQGLKIVSSLSKELENVKKAANMDADVLRSYVSKLELGLEKVKAVLQYEKPNSEGKFFESMKMFLKGAGDEIARIKAQERKALSVVREVTGYFHGDTVKEEAHPLRIFMVVRDFLSTLDNVCKEVGKMNDNTMVGSARSFRVPLTASLPVLSRYNTRHKGSSDDESSSS